MGSNGSVGGGVIKVDEFGTITYNAAPQLYHNLQTVVVKCSRIPKSNLTDRQIKCYSLHTSKIVVAVRGEGLIDF